MVHVVTGHFDVIAFTEFSNTDDLTSLIQTVQSLKGVHKTQTAVSMPKKNHLIDVSINLYRFKIILEKDSQEIIHVNRLNYNHITQRFFVNRVVLIYSERRNCKAPIH